MSIIFEKIKFKKMIKKGFVAFATLFMIVSCENSNDTNDSIDPVEENFQAGIPEFFITR